MSSILLGKLPEPPPLADFACSRLPHCVGEAKMWPPPSARRLRLLAPPPLRASEDPANQRLVYPPARMVRVRTTVPFHRHRATMVVVPAPVAGRTVVNSRLISELAWTWESSESGTATPLT